jgi:predicted AAA+ superfamily ATPase
MKRMAYRNLLQWKSRSDHKPLLVQGARQVGKTYLIKEFGKAEYLDCVYFNFEEMPDAVTLFQSNLTPGPLVESLSAFAGRKINPSTTLMFFDEIQICQRALTSLKYFCEQAPEYHVIAAGSLLGVSIGKNSSFPVGKVEFLDLHPMSFFEYLESMDAALLREHLESKSDLTPLADALHNRLMEMLRYYIFLGGMPAIVDNYVKNRDIQEARRLQKEILDAFERDFSKYSTPSEAIRISEIWQSIPTQLVRENKKFLYSAVGKGARASRFESAIEWLRRAGLILLASNLSTVKFPLKAYVDNGKFKAYMLDTGLLGALVDTEPKAIVTGDRILSEYNGALTENFVATELIAGKTGQLYYWRSENIAEVDFVFGHDSRILPLEVKSGMSRETKSLRIFAAKFKSERIYRTSPRNFTADDDFVNIPLYAIQRFPGLS